MSLTLRRPTDDEPPTAEVPDAAPGTKSKARKTSGPKGAHPGDVLVIGGEPRVDLLPPEVRAQRKAKAMRRSLGFGVLVTLLVVGVAAGGAALYAFQAQANLLTAQADTASLLAQQAKFSQVRTTQSQIDLATAAQQVGASTEIDWKTYLTKVQATLPADVAINTVTIDSATPLALYVQSTAPLQGARVATVTFEARSPTLPVVPAWLTALAKLPGFADATPGSVVLDSTSKLYTVDITLHVNEAAFDKRFNEKEK